MNGSMPHKMHANESNDERTNTMPTSTTNAANTNPGANAIEYNSERATTGANDESSGGQRWCQHNANEQPRRQRRRRRHQVLQRTNQRRRQCQRVNISATPTDHSHHLSAEYNERANSRKNANESNDEHASART
jgi:hypothetical protein